MKRVKMRQQARLPKSGSKNSRLSVLSMTCKGFTLIELMIAVIIIGILAAIVYPSYIDSVRKSRRADAESVLLELANYMERTYTESNKYNPTGFALPITQSPKTGDKFYDISTASINANSYVLQAVPVANTSQAADSCGTLKLSSSGVKTPANCW